MMAPNICDDVVRTTLRADIGLVHGYSSRSETLSHAAFREEKITLTTHQIGNSPNRISEIASKLRRIELFKSSQLLACYDRVLNKCMLAPGQRGAPTR